jgi:D-beta-D-heptose 7-phosphate kinase/D-beta-D-heptose 1-phosphate adenosyltransferase
MKVWVNGTFDVLHKGHIKLLEYESSIGIVRVGVDADCRVKKLKGDSRPVNNLEDRKYLLKSLRCVDSVVDFSTDEELEKQIKEWEAEIMVIGADYKDKHVVGGELVKVIFFDKIDNYSTSKIVK